MKKILSYSAVALLGAFPVAANADVDIYGSLRLGLNNSDAANEDWQVTDELSRIGIKGDFEIYDDITALYQAEFRLRADTGEFAGSGEKNARLSWVGAKGSWGKAQIGRIWMPSQLWLSNRASGGLNDVSLNGTRALAHRMPNALNYYSPKMGGLQLAATGVFGGSGGRFGDAIGGPTFNADKNDNDIDFYSLAGRYNIGPVWLGAAYTTGDATNATTSTDFDFDYTQALAEYKTKPFRVYAYYQEEDGLEGSNVELDTFAVGTQIFRGKNNFQLQYTEHDKSNGAEADRIAAGITHKLNKQARVWVEYANGDTNGDKFKFGIVDGGLVSIGVRYDFSATEMLSKLM